MAIKWECDMRRRIVTGIIIGLTALQLAGCSAENSNIKNEDNPPQAVENSVQITENVAEKESIEAESVETEERETFTGSDDNAGESIDWMNAYRQFFEDVFADRIQLYTVGYKYGEFEENEKLYMTLQDITDDGVPELFLYCACNWSDLGWQAYFVTEEGNVERLDIAEGQIDFYNPQNKKLYISYPNSYTFCFYVYKTEGKVECEYAIIAGDPDYEWGEDEYMRYDYDSNNNSLNDEGYLLSDEEAKAALDEYYTGCEIYAFTGVEISPENLDQYF